jgi:23S rRNA (uracil1939-C5)-methyltransferase
VILDPPRAGASAQIYELAESNISTIVYVSCNPVSFARDAGKLMEGDYVLEALTLVDQFIWSTHTELVGIFKKEAW